MKSIKRPYICGAAIVMAAVLFTGCAGHRDDSSDISVSEKIMQEELASDSSESIDGKTDGYDGYDGYDMPAGAEDFLSCSTKIHLEKIVMTRIELEDGSFDTSYPVYYMADINLLDKSVSSNSYISGEDGFLIPGNEDMEDVDKIFGIRMHDLSNAREAMTAILDASGYSEDFEDTTLDREYFSESGSLCFRYEKPQKALNELMDGMDGYDLADASSYFMVQQIGDDTNIPAVFLSIATFEKDGKVVIKNSFLRIEPVAEDQEAGCQCGHIDMSECDDECAKICNEM